MQINNWHKGRTRYGIVEGKIQYFKVAIAGKVDLDIVVDKIQYFKVTIGGKINLNMIEDKIQYFIVTTDDKQCESKIEAFEMWLYGQKGGIS